MNIKLKKGIEKLLGNIYIKGNEFSILEKFKIMMFKKHVNNILISKEKNACLFEWDTDIINASALICLKGIVEEDKIIPKEVKKEFISYLSNTALNYLKESEEFDDINWKYKGEMVKFDVNDYLVNSKLSIDEVHHEYYNYYNKDNDLTDAEFDSLWFILEVLQTTEKEFKSIYKLIDKIGMIEYYDKYLNNFYEIEQEKVKNK